MVALGAAAADVAAPVAADAIGGAVAGGAASGAGSSFLGGLGPSLISGGLGLFGNAMSQQGQQQTNAQMLAMQQQMEQWQERLSDTSVQRRVADLNAAGLNPLLAVGALGGASTPGISPVTLGNPNTAFAQMGNQATSAIQVGQQQQLNDAQVRKINADAAYTEAQTPDDPAQTRNVASQLPGQQLWKLIEDTGVASMTKQQIAAMIANTREDTYYKRSINDNIESVISKMSSDASIAGADRSVKVALAPLLIERARAEFPSQISTAQRAYELQNNPWWQIIAPFVAPDGSIHIPGFTASHGSTSIGGTSW